MIKISGYSDLQVKMNSLAKAESKFFNKFGKLTIKDMIHLFQDNLSVNTSMKPLSNSILIDTYNDVTIPYYGSFNNPSYGAKNYSIQDQHQFTGSYNNSDVDSDGIIKVSYDLTMNIKLTNKPLDWRSPEALSNLGYKQSDQGNYFWFDGYKAQNGTLHISGWNCSNKDYDYKYHYIILWDNATNKELGRMSVVNTVRYDVASRYNYVYNSKYSGYVADFPITSTDYYNHPLVILSRYTNDIDGNGNGNDCCDYWSSEFRVTNNDGKLANVDDATITLVDYCVDSNSRSIFHDLWRKDMHQGDTVSVTKSFYYPSPPNFNNGQVWLKYISDCKYRVDLTVANYRIIYLKLENPKKWTPFLTAGKDYDGSYNSSRDFDPHSIQIDLSNYAVTDQIRKGSLIFVGFELRLDSDQYRSIILSSNIDVGMTLHFKDGNSVKAKFISNDPSSDIAKDCITAGFQSQTLLYETIGGYFISPTTGSFDYLTIDFKQNSDNIYKYFDQYEVTDLKVDVAQNIHLNDNVDTLYDAYTNLAGAFRAYFKTTTPYKIDDMIKALGGSSSGDTSHTGGDSGHHSTGGDTSNTGDDSGHQSTSGGDSGHHSTSGDDKPKPSAQKYVLIDKNKFCFTSSPGGNDKTLGSGQYILGGNNYLSHNLYNSQAKKLLQNPGSRSKLKLTLYLDIAVNSGDGKVSWGINGSNVYATFDDSMKLHVSSVIIDPSLSVDDNSDLIIKSDQMLIMNLNNCYIEIETVS